MSSTPAGRSVAATVSRRPKTRVGPSADSDEPAHLVRPELLHPPARRLLIETPRIAPVRPRRRRAELRLPVPRAYDSSELAVPGAEPHLPRRRFEQVVEPDLADTRSPARRVGNGAPVGDGVSEGFLDEHVFPRAESGDRLLAMHHGRRDDKHGIDVPGRHVSPVGGDARYPVLRRLRPRPVEIDVAERRHLDAGDRGEIVRVVVEDGPCADDAHADRLHGL